MLRTVSSTSQPVPPHTDAIASVSPRWTRLKVVGGFVAAAALSLYLLVKVIWVVGALLGRFELDGWGRSGFIVLNTVTVGMAVVGVVLGLTLARPWGLRVPAPLVLFFAWTAVGLLVTMLPYMVAAAVFGTSSSDHGGGSGSEMPAWETVFITLGFVGMALGVAAALPVYLRERWPFAFVSSSPSARVAKEPSVDGGQSVAGGGQSVAGGGQSVQGGSSVAGGRRRRSTHHVLTMALIAVVVVTWVSWAAGSTLGLDPGQADRMTANARLLNATYALWAAAGVWAADALARSSSVVRTRPWLPFGLAFAASGMLVGWSSWKLPLAIIGPGDYVAPEYLGVAIVVHATSIVAGLLLLRALISTYAARAIAAHTTASATATSENWSRTASPGHENCCL